MATHLKNLSDFSHLSIPSAAPFHFAIIVAQWNAGITGALLNGAYGTLIANGCLEANITLLEVPGTFELSNAAAIAADSKKYDAIICLGAVIRGQTPHFDYVASEAAKGIAAIAFQTGVPVIFGILTTDTMQQALERAGIKSNHGWHYALNALEMASLMRQLRPQNPR
jgi:6,7-dimethyl-8-ribityllumazine synthase